MSAKVIPFYKITCKRPEQEIVFPPVYRVTGSYYNFSKQEGLRPGNRRASTSYTFSRDDNCGLCNATLTQIDRMSPGLDKGRLFIRRHETKAQAEAYMSCLFDFRDRSTDALSFRTIETEHGIFTLNHWRSPKTREGCLMIYVAEVMEHSMFGLVDLWKIVRPDGSITEDSKIL